MAEALVIGAVVSAVYCDFHNVVKDAVSKMVWCKKSCKALAQDLDTHLPTFREICRHTPRPTQDWEQRLLDFKNQLEQGKLLVESCIEIRAWHLIRRFRDSRAILKLRKQILQNLQNLAAFNTLLLKQLYAHQQVLLEEQDKLQKEIDPLMAMVNENTNLLRDWARLQANSTGTHDEGQTSAEVRKRLDELHVGQFLVGLDNQINEVKSLLLSDEEKTVTILGGMGGIGKTTLALAICKDPQVRDFFKDRIYFFTVSQTPDMMRLLSTIWKEVVGEEKEPMFQNEEDACRQLKGRLLSTPSNLLLVLDDVWSKANLENLLFEGKQCKTLITTRQASILETHNSQIYTLGLLNEDVAQRLFCYWAFGQDFIPKWAEETLVKEVISECKCLPLALKVIGGSLSNPDWFPVAWRNARDKLREAVPLGEYHEDALQRRLQTSIDVLDLQLQECFLDLGAYPEDSQCSVDTLLDIWVYVRGMEWMDAVLALAELGSRGLLDFNYKKYFMGDGRALEYGSAPALNFSQHDVMRDLALYLGRKNHPPSQRSRLLMPQKGRSIPIDWQSVEPLAAQIISISTGAMMEQDWPPALAFPFAEALLLYFNGNAYHLPPFLQSMSKLKVLILRSSKPLQCITGSLEGLSQLQSIDMENVALITPDTTPKLERLRLKARKVPNALSTLKLRDRWCQLRSLQILYLSESFRLHQLPKQLGNLTNLVCLGLRNCNALKRLPDSLCKLQCLEVLDMSGCRNVGELPQNLGKLSALKELSLKACSDLRNLPESFQNLSNLKILDLRQCCQLGYLPRRFGQLVALKKLDLGDCIDLGELPENFGLLGSLEDLSLAKCSKVKELPQNFGLLSNLKRLDLSMCFELEDLPGSFGQLSCLEYLSLESCRELKNLPESFGQLRQLKKLDLEGAGELEALPKNFGELCCLEVLGMASCKKLKKLPESFGQLSELRRWDMKEVELASLPASVGMGGLVGLESVECSEWLVPLWKAVRGDVPPHPRT